MTTSPTENNEQPLLSAARFLREVHRQGGRVYRMPEIYVFCITSNPDLAAWLIKLGATPYQPRGTVRSIHMLPLGAYERARGGTVEWDLYIHDLPVSGEETIHEAAGRFARTVEPTEFA